MNIVYTYTFKFDEPVKISNVNYNNSSVGAGYGENQNVAADKIDGLTSNVNAEGYATEFTIEYNFNKLNLMNSEGAKYIKGESAVITFVDKGGNQVNVNIANNSSITLSILR